MKLTKKTKISLISLLCGMAIIPSVIVVPIINHINNQANAATTDQYYYLFNNRYFESLDAATDWTLDDAKPVSSGLFVGDATDAIFDQESKRIDITQLRPYESGKLYPTYKNSIGQYTHDYKTAKSSFVNQGLIDYLYDDFNNNLHYSEAEAIKAMRDNTFRTPIAYHELNLSDGNSAGKEFTINPFNKADIEVFKTKVIENFNTSKQLDIKAYDLIKDPTRSTDGLAYASLTTQYLNQNADYVDAFYNKVVDQYLKSKTEFFNEIVTWDVTVSMVNYWDVTFNFENVIDLGLDGNKKVFKSFHSDPLNLYFSGVKMANLPKFNIFLNRDDFVNNHTMWIKYADFDSSVSEEAKSINDNLGIKYNVSYVGTDWGHPWPWPGPDIKILTPGNEQGKQLVFDLNFKLTDCQKNINGFEKKMMETFNTEFIASNLITPPGENDEADSMNHLVYSETFTHELYKTIMDSTWRTIWNYEKNSVFNHNRPMYKQNALRSRIREEPLENDFFMDTESRKDENINGWKVIWKNKDDGTGITVYPFIKDALLQDISHLNFSNWSKTLKYYIEYNTYPLFEVPPDIFQKYFTKPEILNGSVAKTLIKERFNPVYDSSVATVLAKNLVNVSSRSASYKNSTYRFNYLPYDISSKTYLYSKYKQNEQGMFEYTDDPPLVDINHKDWSYNIVTAMQSYNKALQYILDNNRGKIPDTTTNLIIKPEEVLTVYSDVDLVGFNEGKLQEKFYYSEYLTSAIAFNDALLDKNNVNLYNSNVDINNAIEVNRILKPAKIVILYDLMGKPLNAGIRLSEDEALETTNDAVYDSRNAVLDNVLRTKIIRNDPTKTFFLEQNGEYTLLKNLVGLIYQLHWDKKTYYFPTWEDARNYLYELIKIVAFKVPR